MEAKIQSPHLEQEICKTCGLCCDGTLFGHAGVDPGEKEYLPDEILKVYYATDGKEGFKLPCPAFNEKCTIYHKTRAKICGVYRCQLLKNFSKEMVNLDEALKIVKKAIQFRSEILSEFRDLENDPEVNYWDIEKKISRDDENSNDKKLDVYFSIRARITIYNLLLTKHFKSSSKFMEMTSEINTDD